MALTNAVESAEDVRKSGNELYKAGKLLEAVACYKHAAELAPSDAAPLSNHSAAYFELGQHKACRETCQAALKLLNNGNDLSAQKLHLRSLKASLLLKDIDHARGSLASLDLNEEKNRLEKCLGLVDDNRHCGLDAEMRIISDLPIIKPQLQDALEYYVIGHDSPESLYDSTLADTFMHIFTDRLKGKLKDQYFHFTLVDIMPAVIARDLLVFLLLDDLSKTIRTKRSERSLLLQCLYYTYLSPIMPGRLAAILQARIQCAIDILEDKQLPPAYLDIPHIHRPKVLRVLKQWQHDASARLPVSKMRRAIVSQQCSERIKWNLQHSRMMGPIPNTAPQWEMEQHFYEQTGVLTMPKPNDAAYQNEIRSAFETSSTGRIERKDAVAEKVEADWASNVTMIDLDWVEALKRLDGSDIDVAHDPWQFGAYLRDLMGLESGARLYDLVAMWFSLVADCFGQLKDNMKIEVCLGNITTVLEQIRCGIIGRRPRSHACCDPDTAQGNDAIISEGEEYPRVYDRIHLSNIPDYIGGTLTSFLYALPLTHPGDSSYITSTCLRNPPRWKSEAHFHNESVGLNAPSDQAKVFRVRSSGSRDLEFGKMASSLLGSSQLMNSYHFWHHFARSQTFADLMPREKLETWLYRVFLKLAIPAHKQAIQSYVLIYSPLTLIVFYRLLLHLSNVGYPAHWLSGVLDNLLKGRINTTARPPRSDLMKIKETKASMPTVGQSVKPFVAEMSTLASIWQSALPFGVLSTNIPRTQEIRKYRINFTEVSEHVDNTAVFVLAFFQALMLPLQPSFRTLLLDDERGQKDPQISTLREEGLHIVTTWEWSRSSKTATFWLRRAVMEGMQRGQDWGVMVWRTDNWTHQSGVQRLDAMDTGVTWMNTKAATTDVMTSGP
ncbi:hypothetical protein Q7P37_008634 [Cladosporium fusiforme]